MNLEQSFQTFAQLLEQGKTLEAIEQFYAEDATQYENHKLLLQGKSALHAHESQNLGKVKDLTITLSHVVLDAEKAKVWGEMQNDFISIKQGRLRLREAFFQQWKSGKIKEQRFYYAGIEKIED